MNIQNLSIVDQSHTEGNSRYPQPFVMHYTFEEDYNNDIIDCYSCI